MSVFQGQMELGWAMSLALLSVPRIGVFLNRGFLEFRIPNYLKANQEFNELKFSFELSSEAPSYNNDWPSDIYFYINDIELGFWTSPGDFG